jgi:hypothetical protein
MEDNLRAEYDLNTLQVRRLGRGMTSKTALGIKELLGEQRLPQRGNCFAPQILAIAEKHGAYNVRVFGSVARGEATEDSDIDFLVD